MGGITDGSIHAGSRWAGYRRWFFHLAWIGIMALAARWRFSSPAMPAFDWKLSDAEIAAVITYLRNSWGNAAAAVSADAVKQQRAALAKQE